MTGLIQRLPEPEPRELLAWLTESLDGSWRIAEPEQALELESVDIALPLQRICAGSPQPTCRPWGLGST